MRKGIVALEGLPPLRKRPPRTGHQPRHGKVSVAMSVSRADQARIKAMAAKLGKPVGPMCLEIVLARLDELERGE